MNRHEHWPDGAEGRDLGALLSDAVADVTPADRLADIRDRTSTRPRRRAWLVAGGGAALATAAVVTAIALAAGGPAPRTGPAPLGTPSVSERPSGTGSPSASTAPSESASTSPADVTGAAVPAYYIGDTPEGPRLYREFQRVSSPTTGLAGLRLLESGALDPDYRTEWPAGSFQSISDPEAGVVHVVLGSAAPDDPSDLALQQVVYTLNAGFQESLDVVLDRGGASSDPITAAPQLEVLALVNLSDPSQGQVVGDTLRVRGLASSFEATVPWMIEDAAGDVVLQYSFMAEGWMDRLYPFHGTVDVSSLEPGTYTFIVKTDDPSGGAEGHGPTADSRTIVIE